MSHYFERSNPDGTFSFGVSAEAELPDETIYAVVRPRPPSEHARANAAQAAMLLEEDREHA